jgi:hypothetical protein
MELKEIIKYILYITATSTITKTRELPLDALELVSDSKESEFHKTGSHAKLYITDTNRNIQRRKGKDYTSN